MDIDKYIQTVLKVQILLEDEVKKLCRLVKELLFQESNIQPVKCPVSVCGDIHGQYYDLKQLFKIGGKLSEQSSNCSYIMIGDFVDRGYHSVQTITLLFCYKVKYPDRMVLLRGNHECRVITKNYGFYDEVQHKYGSSRVWSMFNDAFDYLPIGALIQGRILCVHGGLSPELNSIDHMRSIERAIQIPTYGPFSDLMWSDPSNDIQQWALNDRGAGWLYGNKVVKNFIHNNQLKCIVRAHQMANQGYVQHFGGDLYTIWSAPNYCYRMNNLAAIMKIDDKFQFAFQQFRESKESKFQEHYNKVIPYFL